MSKERQIIEIEALHDLLPEINYYQVLMLERDAEQAAVDPAYRAEARRLHPDRFSTYPAETKKQANTIYRRIGEAYRTLRDPDARLAYDDQLLEGEQRLSNERRREAEAAAKAAANPELAAKTDQGSKYWRLALTCWQQKDYKGCVLQTQFALNFEPDNEVFQEWLEKAKEAAKKKREEAVHNPYKLRIV